MILIPMITGPAVVFGICAVLAILGAVGVVTFTKPVYSALCLALVMICLAVIYASLGAPFLFAVQIIVYTGAVLMLFLFVIMLVGVAADESITETLKGHRVVVALAAIGVLALLTLAIIQGIVGSPAGVEMANDAAGGNVQGLANLIFSRYVIAFEATAALLITAAVAAMVMAHPEQLRAKVGQADRAAARLKAFTESDRHPGPKPSSGVFARHNSIATPALLPDGSVATASLAPALVERVPIPSPEALWEPHDAILAGYETDDELSQIEDLIDDEELAEIEAAVKDTESEDESELAESESESEESVESETESEEPTEPEPVPAEPESAEPEPVPTEQEPTEPEPAGPEPVPTEPEPAETVKEAKHD